MANNVRLATFAAIFLGMSACSEETVHKDGEAEQPTKASSTFDLVCEGAWRPDWAMDGPGTISRKRLRVDLGDMRWCEGKCAETFPIVAADAVSILIKSDSNAEAGKFEDFLVKRESGRYRSERRDGGSTFIDEGVCRPAEFSGFPDAKF